MLATSNNCTFDDLSAIAFNNKMNNMFFSSKSSTKNGGIEKKNGGMEKKEKNCKLYVTSVFLGTIG